jgi:hypothetical protein
MLSKENLNHKTVELNSFFSLKLLLFKSREDMKYKSNILHKS